MKDIINKNFNLSNYLVIGNKYYQPNKYLLNLINFKKVQINNQRLKYQLNQINYKQKNITTK